MTKYRTIDCIIVLSAFALSVTTAAHAASYTVTDLGTLGGTESFGSGLNASGQVAGASYTTADAAYHTFLWTPTTLNGASGTKTDLGTLGGTHSFGNGLNASGQVTGESFTTEDAATHAFLYDGMLNDLGTLGGNSSGGFGINANGQVTGYSQTTGNASHHAFLYTPGSGMVDLNSLIDPLSGWVLHEGYGINDAGQITGWGQFGDQPNRGFLLTPVPEPSTLALVALSAAALAVRRSRRITNLLCLFCALSLTAAAHAATYTITDLGTFGGTSSGGLGINASGQVTGFAYTTGDDYYTSHAFLYDGTLHDLGALGETYSGGRGINASGQMAGYSATTDDTAEHAILWKPTTPGGTSGTMHDLGTLLGGRYSSGYGINDSGQVTGSADTTEAGDSHPFMWKPTTPGGTSGTMHDLGSLGGSWSVGYGINASGQVVGISDTTDDAEQHAFLWKPTLPSGTSGTLYDLGTLGGTYSGGLGINASGQVAGYADTAGDTVEHAILWTPTMPGGTTGTMLDLGTLGGNTSWGEGINDSGQVIGWSEVSVEVPYYTHAFLYSIGSGMVDLNTLIDPLSGWDLLSVTDINDAGQITGQGMINDEYHAFLLTPSLPGDFNHDGTVDAADYVVWRKNGGIPAEYSTWQANFGETVGSGAAASVGSTSAQVPEPAAVMMLLVAMIAMFTCRRAVVS